MSPSRATSLSSKLLLGVVALIAPNVGGRTITYSCPSGWSHESVDSERCYKLLSSGAIMKWDVARDTCQAIGGGAYLFVPSSLQEEWLMRTLFYINLLDQGDNFKAWIGCSDTDSNTTFRCYSENENLAYQNWASGNPDPTKSAQKLNPASMSVETPVESWRQEKPSASRVAICERPASEHVVRSFAQTYVTITPADLCNVGPFLALPSSVKNLIACGAACSKETGCFSFNFIEGGQCQLMGSVTTFMYSQPGCRYYVAAG
ncbi:uncharacterized protein [Diadema setosum]|uniref:uncharacterized protein n=1 Tax=Diadema setosum TaxID=31175 RepID=UPI003B3AD001